MTENGISKYLDGGGDVPEQNWLTDVAASKDMPDGKKAYVKGHKRSQSDTAVPSKIQIKSAKRKMSRIPEISEQQQHLRTDQTSTSSSSGADSMSSLNRSIWKFPPPESEDQSLYDYIQSGKFTKDQSALDIDNAHIILAEAVIYAPQHQIKIKESQEQVVDVVLPPSSPIREKSAEHTILSMLNLLEDPHFIKAVDTFKLLEERSGSGKDQTNGLRSTPDWFPPSKQLVFDYHPKPT